MALPFLPGNSFNPRLGKEKFHLSHHFDCNNEIPMWVGERKPDVGGETRLGQDTRKMHSQIPAGEGSPLPAWLAFDRQVLSFDAFFQEAVIERREEQFRVRECKIYFYLEDDSIQVIEPRLRNSGVPQGTLIRRHRIPKPAPQDDLFYTAEDFNIGVELSLYGKVFKITGCDQFTENFLKKLGVGINLPEKVPSDPYMSHRKALDESCQPLRPYQRVDTLKQFLDHDGHVLRFYCYWDDSDSMFGDSREMVLHYFLADDTIEIREVVPANAGRDAPSVFLRRSRLPKGVVPLKKPGEMTPRTVLNVFGPMGQGGRYILDPLKTGEVNVDYYSDADLKIGNVVNVWGRKFILCDMDDFTKEFYRTKYDMNDFAPVQYKAPPGAKQDKEIPPYNGFGGEEDSLGNCFKLIPEPPKGDFVKFMLKDRCALDSNILRFSAKLVSKKPTDQDRLFIISYYLSDDTISVFEPPQRNSGIIGGGFLHRSQVKKPNQPLFSNKMSEHYTAEDLYIGAQVEFNCFVFKIVDADEYAVAYMEANQGDFTQSSVSNIVHKLRALAAGKIDEVGNFFVRNDPDGSGTVPYEQFKALIIKLTNGALVEHEVISLARSYSTAADSSLDLNALSAMAQDSLRKANFEAFDHLQRLFVHHDDDRNGYIDPTLLRCAVKSLHVPIADDVLAAIVHKMGKDAKGFVQYDELLERINWRKNPQPPLQFEMNRRSVERVVPPPTESVAAINYNQLLKDLFPEGIAGARQEAADAGQIAGGVPGEDIAPKDPSRC